MRGRTKDLEGSNAWDSAAQFPAADGDAVALGHEVLGVENKTVLRALREAHDEARRVAAQLRRRGRPAPEAYLPTSSSLSLEVCCRRQREGFLFYACCRSSVSEIGQQKIMDNVT